MLGLGSSVSKRGGAGSTVVTDGLVLKHNYDRSAVGPVSSGAASFDGTSDYVNTGSAFQSTFQDSFSISMWIKAVDGIPSAENTILGTIKCGWCKG